MSPTLADRFEADRDHLRAVAYRLLGSAAEAEDAVQEAWLRLARVDPDDIDNLTGWLTTVVGRIGLDMLRSRKSRREDPLEPTEQSASPDLDTDPESVAVLADSVGVALSVVLDALNPVERLAFVLHDMFSIGYDEIAPIVGRSEVATRQLASRARRRVQSADLPETDIAEQREVVDAFLAASRNGEFETLLALLDPEVTLRADQAAVGGAQAGREHGAPLLAPLVTGRREVAEIFRGRARDTRPAMVDGSVGAAWAPEGTTRAVFGFRIVGGRVTDIRVTADPGVIAGMYLQLT